jgi:ubiquinone/menaquinone biosynthesis C-methylase UbiE
MTLTTKIGKRFWQLYFKVYDRNQSEPYKRLLTEGADKVVGNPSGRYLDLGCGSGNSTLAIGQHLNSDGGALGIDTSLHALEIARKKGKFGGLENVSFQQGDMGKPLPFESETFDGILANNSFYLVSDPRQTLIEVMRLLKPGGVFLMTNPKEAASSYEIFKGHLAAMKEKYSSRFGRLIGGAVLAGHTLRAVYNFALLLPFQLVLKNSYKVESHFWSVERWSGIIEKAKLASPYPFSVREPFFTYAGQNHTFVFDRLPQ